MTQRTYDQILKELRDLENMFTVARADNKRLREENSTFREALRWSGSCALTALEKFPGPNEPPPRSSKVVPLRPTNGSAS